MIDIDERIRYYIGNTDFSEPVKDTITHGYDKPILLNYEDYSRNNNFLNIHPNTSYYLDVAKILYITRRPHYIQCGDSCYEGKGPVFVKVRTEDPSHGGIIFNLDSRRHWDDSMIDSTQKVPWDNKLNDIVWRGSDTGRGVRLNFVKKFYKIFNIGFSNWVQDKFENPELYLDEYLKPKMSVDEMLRYKYLPVVDGNDKSSSLGWVLASNSVPLMPIPKYHSWICEKWLIPGVHYVEVKRDFSDLEEKIQWCRENDDRCMEIARNGTEFMLQFTNPRRENYIVEKLLINVNNEIAQRSST